MPKAPRGGGSEGAGLDGEEGSTEHDVAILEHSDVVLGEDNA
jgi:hypothetical protein